MPLSPSFSLLSFLPRRALFSPQLSLFLPRAAFTPRIMSTTRQQPPWREPPAHPSASSRLPPLKIWNSLTRSKTPFVPIDPEGKKVLWYACGPTVYDDSHLGHARNYMSTDIIRRIMRDYFGFQVRFVMNVTDVDDKVGLSRLRRCWVKEGTNRCCRLSCARANSIFSRNSYRRTRRLIRRPWTQLRVRIRRM